MLPRLPAAAAALLGVLVLFVELVPDVSCQYQCLFHQRLEPRRAYSIASPGYPARYQPGESCQWVATASDASARVVLDCDVFDLPPPKVRLHSQPISVSLGRVGPHPPCVEPVVSD